MSEFAIGQIFESDYPVEAAEWCNASNSVYITEIEPLDGIRRFQIVDNTQHEEAFEKIQVRYTESGITNKTEERISDLEQRIVKLEAKLA